jgi:RecA-family ATPase
MNDDFEPWKRSTEGNGGFPGRYREHRTATSHSAIIKNGRPADLQPLASIDLMRWEGEPVPDRRWLVPDLIPEDEVTMLSGDGGNGKSLLALQLAVAAVLGKPWIGRSVRRCKVLGLFCEDSETELHIRLGDILKHYGATFGDVAEDLRISSHVGQENSLMEWREWHAPGVTTALYTRLEQAVIDHGAEIVILDSLHDVFSGDEIKRTHARQFINTLASIAGQVHGAVLLCAHPSLAGRNSGTGESGSTGWRNTVRSMLYLTRPKDSEDDEGARDQRILKTKKANRGPEGGSIRLRWSDGVFLSEANQQPAGFVEVLQLDQDLVEGLRSLVSNGALVPADPKAPRGFANAVRDLPSCKRYAWGVICSAQARLLDQGKLVRVEMGPKSRRRVYLRPADMMLPGEVKGETP